ncbi:MAG: UTP--glucose-1-phosphate uridylyltransferase GalU [Methanomassiliicoccales archaeon]
MKAVIPAAGLGTRFLPLTKGQPKEMLPIVDKPTIQYVVEEALAAGIDDIIIVTGRDKRAIEDHFDHCFELESYLRMHGRLRELEELEKISNMASIHYVRQKRAAGLGDAIYQARKHIGGESFAVMLGDTIYRSNIPVVSQLNKVHAKTKSSVIAMERVPKSKVSKYGIIKGKMIQKGVMEISDLVEKPSLEQAPSNIAIAGTYILTPSIFDCISRTEPGLNGEVQLTDALRLLLNREKIYGLMIEGVRYDVGDMLGWLKTNMVFVLEDPRYANDMKKFLRSYLQSNSKSKKTHRNIRSEKS